MIRNGSLGSSCHGTAETNPTRNHEVAGSTPGLTQWVKGLSFRELWCRSQTRLGSGVAVALAQAGSNSSDQTPSPRTSIYRGWGPKKDKKTKRKKKKKKRNGSLVQFYVVQKHPSGVASECTCRCVCVCVFSLKFFLLFALSPCLLLPIGKTKST